MTQPTLFDSPTPRHTKRVNVPASSRLTYQAEHGRLEKRAENVRTWLKAHEDWQHLASMCRTPTSAELSNWVFGKNEEPVVDALYVRRGLSDLQAAGVAEHVPGGDRKCRVSGRTCATWRLRQR